MLMFVATSPQGNPEFQVAMSIINDMSILASDMRSRVRAVSRQLACATCHLGLGTSLVE
jgi:hypothetical protein